MSSENTSAGTVLLAALGGAIMGAGIALLYAPQSGKRTRLKIREFGDDAEDYARELLEKGQQLVEAKKQQLVAALDGAKNAR